MRFLVLFAFSPVTLFQFLRTFRIAWWVGYFCNPKQKSEFVRESHSGGIARRYHKSGRYFLVACRAGNDTSKDAIEIRRGNRLRLRLTRQDGTLFNKLKRLVAC